MSSTADEMSISTVVGWRFKFENCGACGKTTVSLTSAELIPM